MPIFVTLTVEEYGSILYFLMYYQAWINYFIIVLLHKAS